MLTYASGWSRTLLRQSSRLGGRSACPSPRKSSSHSECPFLAREEFALIPRVVGGDGRNPLWQLTENLCFRRPTTELPSFRFFFKKTKTGWQREVGTLNLSVDFWVPVKGAETAAFPCLWVWDAQCARTSWGLGRRPLLGCDAQLCSEGRVSRHSFRAWQCSDAKCHDDPCQAPV